MLSRISLEAGAFVAVDLETTGSLPGRNSIIEVGAARVERGSITDVFRAFVRPTDAVPPSVTYLTGITDAMLADAPDIEDVMDGLHTFIGDGVVIAHNHRFDMGFLDHEAERLWGDPFPRPVLDTLAIARRLHPDVTHLNLRQLAGLYETSLPTHRARDDAVATAEIFARMVPELRALGLETVGDVAAYCGMRLQSRLSRKLILAHDAPDAPGVFLFRDRQGKVMFVDRAKNLRSRIRSHFYSVTESYDATPALDTESITYIACRSELDAVLLESRLLHRYHPAHNHASERGRQPFVLAVHDDGPFPALEVVDAVPDGAPAVGPFTSRWAAETLADGLRAEFGLRRCVKRLAAGAALEYCPHRAATGCPRPCVAAVDEGEYRERLAAAFDVFEGTGDELRVRLQAGRDEAVRISDRGEAARYRDVIRALDRSLSALDVVRTEAAREASAIVEGDSRGAVVHLLAGGYRRSVVRLHRHEILAGTHVHRLRLALARVPRPLVATDPLRLSRRQLKDLFLIRGYRETRSPLEIELPVDGDEALRVIDRAVQPFIRPRGDFGVAV